MEGSVGETVDCEDAAVVGFEPQFEQAEVVVLQDFPGRERGKAETDGERVISAFTNERTHF